MRETQSLIRKMRVLNERLHPPARDTRLPHIILDSETGLDLQGFEEHNRSHEQLARFRDVAPKCYLFDPSDDGTEE